ncbi:hypothetical protein ACJX0J_023206 [Zea mays]
MTLIVFHFLYVEYSTICKSYIYVWTPKMHSLADGAWYEQTIFHTDSLIMAWYERTIFYTDSLTMSTFDAEVQLVVIVMQSMYLAFSDICCFILIILQINTQSVQDMHIDADPSHVPVILLVSGTQKLMKIKHLETSKKWESDRYFMNLHLTIALFVHTVENIGELQKYHILILSLCPNKPPFLMFGFSHLGLCAAILIYLEFKPMDWVKI